MEGGGEDMFRILILMVGSGEARMHSFCDDIYSLKCASTSRMLVGGLLLETTLCSGRRHLYFEKPPAIPHIRGPEEPQ